MNINNILKKEFIEDRKKYCIENGELEIYTDYNDSVNTDDIDDILESNNVEETINDIENKYFFEYYDNYIYELQQNFITENIINEIEIESVSPEILKEIEKEYDEYLDIATIIEYITENYSDFLLEHFEEYLYPSIDMESIIDNTNTNIYMTFNINLYNIIYQNNNNQNQSKESLHNNFMLQNLNKVYDIFYEYTNSYDPSDVEHTIDADSLSHTIKMIKELKEGKILHYKGELKHNGITSEIEIPLCFKDITFTRVEGNYSELTENKAIYTVDTYKGNKYNPVLTDTDVSNIMMERYKKEYDFMVSDYKKNGYSKEININHPTLLHWANIRKDSDIITTIMNNNVTEKELNAIYRTDIDYIPEDLSDNDIIYEMMDPTGNRKLKRLREEVRHYFIENIYSKSYDIKYLTNVFQDIDMKDVEKFDYTIYRQLKDRKDKETLNPIALKNIILLSHFKYPMLNVLSEFDYMQEYNQTIIKYIILPNICDKNLEYNRKKIPKKYSYVDKVIPEKKEENKSFIDTITYLDSALETLPSKDKYQLFKMINYLYEIYSEIETSLDVESINLT